MILGSKLQHYLSILLRFIYVILTAFVSCRSWIQKNRKLKSNLRYKGAYVMKGKLLISYVKPSHCKQIHKFNLFTSWIFTNGWPNNSELIAKYRMHMSLAVLYATFLFVNQRFNYLSHPITKISSNTTLFLISPFTYFINWCFRYNFDVILSSPLDVFRI